MKTTEDARPANRDARSQTRPRTQFVDRAEFSELLVSRRRLVRLWDPFDDSQRLSDPQANVVFVLSEG